MPAIKIFNSLPVIHNATFKSHFEKVKTWSKIGLANPNYIACI